MNTEELWKHTWPSSELLCEFVLENDELWRDATTLELGAGAAALPTLTALRCGAREAWITEQPQLEKAFECLRENVARNVDKAERVHITGLDWRDHASLCALLSRLTRLDFVLGSDVFFDPQVFRALVRTLRLIFDSFPLVEFFFIYQIRDSEWSIEDLLVLNGLVCVPIRLVDTDQHSFYVAKIFVDNNRLTIAPNLSIISTTTMASTSNGSTPTDSTSRVVYAGVEGGATHSALVLVSGDGRLLGEWHGDGMNCLLHGTETTADRIAAWIRARVRDYNTTHAINDNNKAIHLPVDTLGLGLSGAEDTSTYNRMLDYIRAQHADLAKNVALTSDSVVAAFSAFENGGVVLVAGTGSACRLIESEGTFHGVGGWGHLIGDGGGAFWISMRVIRVIFDVEDGMEEESGGLDISAVKNALFAHFCITDKLQILDVLYGENFQKSAVASFTVRLAELAENGDTFAASAFESAGVVLAKHLCAVSRHFPTEMFLDVPILAIGSVFKSWKLLRKGFHDTIIAYNVARSNKIARVRLSRLHATAAIGAALFGAKSSTSLSSSSHAASSQRDIAQVFAPLQRKCQFDELLFD